MSPISWQRGKPTEQVKMGREDEETVKTVLSHLARCEPDTVPLIPVKLFKVGRCKLDPKLKALGFKP